MTKHYDAAYFEKWYRSSRTRVHSHDEVRRKIVLAVATAEYFLQRRLESVLDVGCGEGGWLTHLRPLRPGINYTGLDSSEYAIRRFGKRRNIRFGTFGGLGKSGLSKRYDLVVCSDVLHYVDDEEVAKGLPHLVRLTAGVAYIEVLTKEDSIVGDLEGLTQRPARWYKKTFQKAGLAQAGPYLWLGSELREAVGPMERA